MSSAPAPASPARPAKVPPFKATEVLPLICRRHTAPGSDPLDRVDWEMRTAIIGGDKGTVFEQKDVEVPEFWSQMATNVVAQKYFRGSLGTEGRESSVKQLIRRVANTISAYGWNGGYFQSEEERETFRAELTHMLLHQRMAFNSPVWFNVGVESFPQCSACFINSITDEMGAILDLAKTEGMLFKYGSGTGTNFSVLRSSKEELRGGGTASGPVSFMRGFDSFAGVIKSGGKTRRAAKMVMLNVDHPDIFDFIRCKADEEKKAWALIDAGYDGNFNVPGGAYDSIQFQNANHSVRVTDAFMESVKSGGQHETHAIVTGQVVQSVPARDVWRALSQAAWECGDPGVQFDTQINDWHTCPNTGRINASNPCSEYMFLDDSACNLASLNLMKYQHDGQFDVGEFRHDVEVSIMAQEILVGMSRYPTTRITENSHDFRPLGLGYANLGAYVMSKGWAYDSDEARTFCASVTALMTGAAYAQSSLIASRKGQFKGYAANAVPFMRVMEKHANHSRDLSGPLAGAAKAAWKEVLLLGKEHGFRNAQVTVLAPTGTIAFMMDCDTTGIEPDIALVKYKKLVGGGTLKMANATVEQALEALDYAPADRVRILEHISTTDTIEGAPGLRDEHLPVFDCAFKPTKGVRSIPWEAHLRMMSAAQPFLSGAISKTVNMPSDATVEDVERAYMMAYHKGLKAVAIYRDGCKRTQPLTTSQDKKPEVIPAVAIVPQRHRLPEERTAMVHKFSVSGHEGYITMGMYPDGKLGEIFVQMAKEGSTVSGLMDAFSTVFSIALQYGVPVESLVNKLAHARYEPSGWTANKEIPMAKSITDYVARWLASKHLSVESRRELGIHVDANLPEMTLPDADYDVREAAHAKAKAGTFLNNSDAPSCHLCGEIMVRNGSCYRCHACGSTSGCS